MRSFTRLVIVFLLGVFLSAPASGVAAQATPAAATPEAVNPFADLGLSEIGVTVTDDAYEGVPSELEAGRYLLTLTNESEEEQGAVFLQIPEGITTAEFLEMAAPAASPEAATPLASPGAEEAGGDETPPWYYETMIAGGPYAAAGTTNYAVIDLTAGEWVLWAEYPGAPQAPVPVTVSGEPPADPPVPEADVSIAMADHVFALSDPLAAGPQVIELTNVGEQPHFLGMAGVPEGTTVEDVLALFESFNGDPAATPAATPATGLTEEDLTFPFGTGDQSAGVTAWYSATFDPGTYVAVCFIIDPETGLPHAALGMIELVVIE